MEAAAAATVEAEVETGDMAEEATAEAVTVIMAADPEEAMVEAAVEEAVAAAAAFATSTVTDIADLVTVANSVMKDKKEHASSLKVLGRLCLQFSFFLHPWEEMVAV